MTKGKNQLLLRAVYILLDRINTLDGFFDEDDWKSIPMMTLHQMQTVSRAIELLVAKRKDKQKVSIN